MSTIELIYDSDCPNVAATRHQLLCAFTALGLAPEWREWDRDEPDSPVHVRNYGSPTILVDGKDIAGTEAEPEASCCRIYSNAEGQASGVPALAQIKSALLARQQSGGAHGGSRLSKWKSSFPALPSVGIALLPKLTCVACWPAYAGLLSALGVGFVDYTPYLLPATAAFLLLTLVALAYRAHARRGYAPFALGVIAAVIVLVGKFALDSDTALYGGIALLVAASLWNAWPARTSAACEQCASS